MSKSQIEPGDRVRICHPGNKKDGQHGTVINMRTPLFPYAEVQMDDTGRKVPIEKNRLKVFDQQKLF